MHHHIAAAALVSSPIDLDSGRFYNSVYVLYVVKQQVN